MRVDSHIIDVRSEKFNNILSIVFTALALVTNGIVNGAANIQVLQLLL